MINTKNDPNNILGEKMKILVLIMSLMIFSSCDSPTESKPKGEEKFQLRYVVKNIKSDGEVNAVELETATYFPDGNYTRYLRSNFQKNKFKPEISVFSPESVKIGCRRQFQLYVSKIWRESFPHDEWRVFYFGEDTIKSLDDSVYIITWPTDTTKADSIYYYID